MADDAVKPGEPKSNCDLEILSIGGQPVSGGEPQLDAANAPWTVHVRMRHPTGIPITRLDWVIAGNSNNSSEPPADAANGAYTDWVEHDLEPPMSAGDVNSTNGRTNINVVCVTDNEECAPGEDTEYFTVSGFSE